MMDNILITEREFELYEQVRSSGITNMFALERVQILSGLSKELIIAIQENYSELMKKYPEVLRKREVY